MLNYIKSFSIATRRKIAIASFASLCGIVGILAAHVSIFLRLKGYNAFEIGVLNGILNLSGVFGPLIISYILQITQAYKRVIIGMCISAALMFTGLWEVSSFYISALFIFGFGFVMSSFGSVQETTYVNFLYNPYNEYGFVRTMGSVGYVSVALLLGFFPLLDIGSINQILYFAYIAFSIVTIACIVFVPSTGNEEEQINDEEDKRSFFKAILGIRKIYYLILCLVFFNFAGLRVIETFIGLLAREEYGLKSITLLFVISAGFEIITIYFGQIIVNRIGYILPWFLVLIGTTLRLILLGSIQNLFLLYISQALHIFSFGLMLSTLIHFVNHAVSPKNKSIAMGLFQMVVSIATILAVIVGGAILEKTNYYTMFLYMSIFPLSGLTFLLIIHRKLLISAVYEHKVDKPK